MEFLGHVEGPARNALRPEITILIWEKSKHPYYKLACSSLTKLVKEPSEVIIHFFYIFTFSNFFISLYESQALVTHS